ncbi:GLPGLI family protein [Siphonobacter sp. SORGH_AS 1065]|nr:GLPGLI family protein [Siphonobacter sp. SORGH_AS_1065]
MKKKLLVVFGWLMVMCTYAQAQELEGTVTYERNTSYTKMVAKLPYLSQEEKDRAKMMWGNEEGDKQKMKLTFTPDQSLYTYIGEQGETDDGRWSWRQSDYVIQRNFEKQTLTELQEFAGKTLYHSGFPKGPQVESVEPVERHRGPHLHEGRNGRPCEKPEDYCLVCRRYSCISRP